MEKTKPELNLTKLNIDLDADQAATSHSAAETLPSQTLARPARSLGSGIALTIGVLALLGMVLFAAWKSFFRL